MYRHLFTGSITVLMLFLAVRSARAQEVDDVTLTFAYPAIGQVYVNAVFRGEQPLLALGEILGLLYIPYQKIDNAFGFTGSYPMKSDIWEIDPIKFTYHYKGEKRQLNATQFYLGDADLYLTPDIFFQLFGIELVVNPYGLMLTMKSANPLPIEELKKRQAIRAKLKDQAPESLLLSYPMLFPRKRAFFAPGMLDYNLGLTNSLNFQQLTYTLNGGMEIFGGDFQGGMFGFRSELGQSVGFSALRWRYVFNSGLDNIGNPSVSEFNIGQISLGGPIGGRIRGASLSNNPIVPRRVLDVFAIEGTTIPDSEIELLIGGQLIDFTRADEVGYYRFTTPLTYGTIRIGLRIYTPSGEVLFEDRQLQIPFTFLPQGTLTYNLQVGFEELGFDSVGSTPVAHADLTYGLTNNITIRAGVNRGLDTTGTGVQPYGSISTRLLDQYLLNVDVLPNTFTRASASVFYANNTSVNLQFTDYTGVTNLNTRGEQKVALLSYFLPVTVFERASGLRIGVDRTWFNNGNAVNYQVDINTRIGPIVTRLNFREEVIQRSDSVIAPLRLATAALTYTIPRKPGIPVFVRGMFFRTQLRHDMKRLDATALGTLQFSQTVFKRGRINLIFDHDFLRKINQFQVGFLYDFNAARTSTQATIQQRGKNLQVGFQQGISGSLGADLRNGVIVPSNRDQVGRAGVTVRMFVDANSNGAYDKGEELISSKAVRLDQSANLLIGSDGMLRITQLQSYWTYRLTVDITSLPDPTLLPLKTKFSFVADPNRFKLIDIPLYRTGTIEGFVYRDRGAGLLDPQPGLRLIMQREGDEEPLPPIRTYSDGGFYAYGLIPGNYTMLVDTIQLAFMNVIQVPDTLRFTIRPLPDGDYIDTLEIKLIPAPADSTKPEAPMTLAQLEYMLGERLKQSVTAFSEAQEHFYRANYSNALAMVDSSLTGFPSDFGLALKGSITYLLGDKKTARDLWSEARYRNPFIEVPDTTQIVFQPLQSDLLAGRTIPVIPPPAFDTIEYSFSLELMENFEAELGGALNAAVSAFVEAQELFYRRRYFEADAMIDTSLSIFVTDHALALKGSILYITSRQEEAWRIWAEARERNPLIILPETQILDRLIKPVARISTNGQKKYSLN